MRGKCPTICFPRKYLRKAITPLTEAKQDWSRPSLHTGDPRVQKRGGTRLTSCTAGQWQSQAESQSLGPAWGLVHTCPTQLPCPSLCSGSPATAVLSRPHQVQSILRAPRAPCSSGQAAGDRIWAARGGWHCSQDAPEVATNWTHSAAQHWCTTLCPGL